MTLLLVILFVWMAVLVVLRFLGLSQARFRSTLTDIEIRSSIGKAFPSITWAETNGPGDLNFRPRARAHAPTISISTTPTTGGTDVHIWTSAYTGYLGVFMGHGLLCWRKRAALVRRLSSSDSASPAIG